VGRQLVGGGFVVDIVERVSGVPKADKSDLQNIRMETSELTKAKKTDQS
jgi:hypothetical protein